MDGLIGAWEATVREYYGQDPDNPVVAMFAAIMGDEEATLPENLPNDDVPFPGPGKPPNSKAPNIIDIEVEGLPALIDTKSKIEKLGKAVKEATEEAVAEQIANGGNIGKLWWPDLAESTKKKKAALGQPATPLVATGAMVRALRDHQMPVETQWVDQETLSVGFGFSPPNNTTKKPSPRIAEQDMLLGTDTAVGRGHTTTVPSRYPRIDDQAKQTIKNAVSQWVQTDMFGAVNDTGGDFLQLANPVAGPDLLEGA